MCMYSLWTWWYMCACVCVCMCVYTCVRAWCVIVLWEVCQWSVGLGGLNGNGFSFARNQVLASSPHWSLWVYKFISLWACYWWSGHLLLIEDHQEVSFVVEGSQRDSQVGQTQPQSGRERLVGTAIQYVSYCGSALIVSRMKNTVPASICKLENRAEGPC